MLLRFSPVLVRPAACPLVANKNGDALFNYLIIFIVCLAGLLVLFAFKTRRRIRQGTSRFPASSEVRSEETETVTTVSTSPDNEDRVVTVLRGKLLLKALGNKSVVERLIAFERANNPAGDQTQWLNAAIRRWEQDNDRR
jgi:hypothetical protein